MVFVRVLIIVMLIPFASLSFAEPVSPTTPVWVAAANNYYHKWHCSLIKVGFNTKKLPIQLAMQKGYRPHKKCSPPTEISKVLPPEKIKKPRSVTIATRPGVGSSFSSAADFERDPDGTVVGRGGGMTVFSTSASRPIKPKQSLEESRLNIKILDVRSKLIRHDGYGSAWFTIRAHVRNLSKKDQNVYIRLRGLDRFGYEIASEAVTGRLAGGATDYLTERTFMDSGTYANIRKWAVK